MLCFLIMSLHSLSPALIGLAMPPARPDPKSGAGLNYEIGWRQHLAMPVRRVLVLTLLLLSRLFQRRHVNHKTVFHIILQQPLISLVDLLNTNCLYVRGDVMLAAEIQHLLSLADAANQ